MDSLGEVSHISLTDAMPRKGWKRRAQLFLHAPAVELTIGVLILASVLLTLLEIALVGPTPFTNRLALVNDAITWIFVVELSLRFAAASSKARFFRGYWIDIIAVLPVFRVFRVMRALRLLRMLRMLRLFGLLNRYASYFPYVFRRGVVEYGIVSGLIVLTIVFGTAALLIFERKANPAVGGFAQAFWFSLYSLFAGEPIPGPPVTLGGQIVTVFIMFMGMTIFAMFTGTVSAFMVERLRAEGRVVDWEEFRDHLIICGWNRKAEIIVREWLAARPKNNDPVVVIAELDGDPVVADPKLRGKIQFLDDDFTKVAALEKAGIHRAQTCVVLADFSRGRSEQDSDARTILAALTVERLNSNVYTCAELHHREYGAHLHMGNVNDFVVSGEHSAFLLAHAALNRGLMGIFTELLTYERGNQFYRLPAPDEWVGKSFLDAFFEMKQRHNAILLAVYEAEGAFRVNPDDYAFAGGEHVIVIAREQPTL